MKHATMKQLERAMENARLEGYAVIGFAVNPMADSDSHVPGLIKLDNQNLVRRDFLDMLGEAAKVFVSGTTDDPSIKIVN